MLNVRDAIGTHDVLFVTLDTLRYDVAERALAEGRTPELAGLLPDGRWERRHTPASFTYAAHHAFFAGFFPTPIGPGPHTRPFALAFPGSETIGPETCVLEVGDTILAGLAALGYHTVCIGGVGFFDGRTPLGKVLPSMFAESHWSPELGVTDPRSTERQVDRAIAVLGGLGQNRRVFMFVDVSALHQPNCIFAHNAVSDSPSTMADALAYVDSHIARLVDAMRRRADLLVFLTSDHGTAYGEDGHVGHRIGHPIVWTVPYAEVRLPKRGTAP